MDKILKDHIFSDSAEASKKHLQWTILHGTALQSRHINTAAVPQGIIWWKLAGTFELGGQKASVFGE